jgi:hypothetical protein
MTKSAAVNRDARRQKAAVVWEKKATFIWQTDDGHAAQSITFPKVNGVILQTVVSISSVTANPTVSITIDDELSAAIIADTILATLADGTVHVKQAPTDFDEACVNGDVIVTVDPSADAGGSAQTLTVVVSIKGL